MVIISNNEGGFVKEWYPFAGALVEDDGYYKIRRGTGMTQWMGRRITTILARQLMPKAAFDWLAGDANIFTMWLALLLDDKEAGGMFTLFFQRVMSKLVEFRQSQGFIMELDIEILDPEETKLGEMFIAWLKDYLRRSKTINEPEGDVQFLKQGLAVKLGSLVKKFAEDQHRHVVPVAEVGKQLKKLGKLQRRLVLTN